MLGWESWGRRLEQPEEGSDFGPEHLRSQSALQPQPYTPHSQTLTPTRTLSLLPHAYAGVTM